MAFALRWEHLAGSELRSNMVCLLLSGSHSGCIAEKTVVGGSRGGETREEATAISRQERMMLDQSAGEE